MSILVRGQQVEDCGHWVVLLSSVFSHTLQSVDYSVSVLTDEVYF